MEPMKERFDSSEILSGEFIPCQPFKLTPLSHYIDATFGGSFKERTVNFDKQKQHFGYSLTTMSPKSPFYSYVRQNYWKRRIIDDFSLGRSPWLETIWELFDAVFGKSFEERSVEVNKPIILDELDAEAFREITYMMFKGDLHVNDSNVYELLRASDFLLKKSHFVKDACFEYLRSKDSEPVPNAFKILTFAHVTQREQLVNLLSAHILKHAKHFSEDVMSVEISFEVLTALLKRFAKLSEYFEDTSRNKYYSIYETGNALLILVLRWVNHSRSERSIHWNELFTMIHFSNVSKDFILFLHDQYNNFFYELVCCQNWKPLENLDRMYIPPPISEMASKTSLTFKIENVSQMVMNIPIYSPHCCTILDQKWRMAVCCKYHLNASLESASLESDSGESGKSFQIVVCSKGKNEHKCDLKTKISLVSQERGVHDLTKEGHRKNYIERARTLPIHLITYAVVFKWNEIALPPNAFLKNDAVHVKACMYVNRNCVSQNFSTLGTQKNES